MRKERGVQGLLEAWSDSVRLTGRGGRGQDWVRGHPLPPLLRPVGPSGGTSPVKGEVGEEREGTGVVAGTVRHPSLDGEGWGGWSRADCSAWVPPPSDARLLRRQACFARERGRWGEERRVQVSLQARPDTLPLTAGLGRGGRGQDWVRGHPLRATLGSCVAKLCLPPP